MHLNTSVQNLVHLHTFKCLCQICTCSSKWNTQQYSTLERIRQVQVSVPVVSLEIAFLFGAEVTVRALKLRLLPALQALVLVQIVAVLVLPTAPVANVCCAWNTTIIQPLITVHKIKLRLLLHVATLVSDMLCLSGFTIYIKWRLLHECKFVYLKVFLICFYCVQGRGVLHLGLLLVMYCLLYIHFHGRS